jgi:hypothetical protein
MSRLIDADTVKRAFIGNRYGTKAIEYVIDEAPTVKAIPIEWIKKYYTDITSPYTDTRIQFEEMIRKWEKENEIN